MARFFSAHLASFALLALALFVSGSEAQRDGCPSKDIQLNNPRQDWCNPIRYLPSIPLAVVAGTLYALTGFSLLFLMFRFGQKWTLTLSIGALCYSFGMFIRLLFRQNTHASGVYIVLYLFTTLAPCAFLAGDYVLLGRIVRHIGMDKHLLINARKTTTIFVVSDVCTFLIQAAGGGLSTAKSSANLPKIGSDIFLAGIALQMASFLIFTIIALHFGYKIRKHEPQLWYKSQARSPEDVKWRSLYFAMLWTCIGFLVRSFFRTVELSQGYVGYLATHEAYIFGLDTLPLFVAIVIYIPFYPGRYLRPNTAGAHEHAYDAQGNLKLAAIPDSDLPIIEEKPKRSWRRPLHRKAAV